MVSSLFLEYLCTDLPAGLAGALLCSPWATLLTGLFQMESAPNQIYCSCVADLPFLGNGENPSAVAQRPRLVASPIWL